jgi:hypothetical protein
MPFGPGNDRASVVNGGQLSEILHKLDAPQSL